MPPAFSLAEIREKFRAEMPVAESWVYLDHAAVSPLSGPSQIALQNWAAQSAQQGDTVWPTWAKRVEEVRATAARLVNADSAEIALVPNTTFGLNLVAEGLPWQPGDNVVTLAHEFPSNRYPWMHLASRGVEVRVVEVPQGRVDLERIERQIDSRTRLVAASWVGYASGFRIDPAELASLCHRRGTLFMLDAIQGLGVFPLDVRQTGVDFFAADGHKWLLGPEGAGIFFLRREHLDLLRPQQVGWNSVQNPYDFGTIDLQFRAAASRYEGGSQNMAGMAALGGSLDLLESLGVGPKQSSVADLVLQFTDEAVGVIEQVGGEVLSCREGDRRSGIVSFQLPGILPATVREHLLGLKIVTSVRGGGVRISPHGYNGASELAAFGSALAEVVTNQKQFS